jgi:hypothetical protein
VGVVVVGVVGVVVVAQLIFYVSPDLCMLGLRKLGSVCILVFSITSIFEASKFKLCNTH